MAIAQKAKAAAAPPAPARVSLNPESATHGGLIDDIDIEITDAQTALYDYGGASEQGDVPVLAVEFTDVNGKAEIQYYSVGKAEDWAPTEDGTGFFSTSGKTGFNDSTNIMRFFKSLVEQGFPADKLDEGDVKVLIGLKAHVNQVVVERKGLVRTGKNADRPPQVLLVTKIHHLPGGKSTGMPAKAGAVKTAVGGKANGAAASTPAAAAATADGIDAKVAEILNNALVETGEAIAKKDIGKTVFKALTAEGLPPVQVNKHVTRSNAADFLAGLEEAGMVFDGKQLALATE